MSDTPLTRRELLTRGAGAVVAAGASAAAGYWLFDPLGNAGRSGRAGAPRKYKDYFGDVDFSASHPRISVALGENDQIELMVRAAVGGLAPDRGIKQFIAKDDVVLIKPNVGFDRPPYLGATTHPEVIRAVLRLCREAGAGEIIVTDHPIESAEACFARSGIAAVARAEGATVILPSPRDFEVVTLRDCEPDTSRGEVIHKWPMLYRPFQRATKVIGVAPIKDHNLCSASMMMKNWYGLLGGQRNRFHQAIHGTISDLGLMISPTLVIGDATRVMMRSGPTGGRISDVAPGGLLGKPAIVAAVDPVAGDAWCYQHLLGRDPAQLLYLEWASQKIKAQVASGVRRFGKRDWQTYDRQGKIVTSRV